MSARTRCGLTLIEVIVCISILATLAALLLPATRSARGTARRTQCQSNLRNVDLAVQAYSTAHRGAVPLLTGGFSIAVRLVLVRLRGRFIYCHIWNVRIVLIDCSVFPSGEVSKIAIQAIESFLCPDAKNSGKGGLSYVANAA